MRVRVGVSVSRGEAFERSRDGQMVLPVAGKLPVADSGVVSPPEALSLNLFRVQLEVRKR